MGHIAGNINIDPFPVIAPPYHIIICLYMGWNNTEQAVEGPAWNT